MYEQIEDALTESATDDMNETELREALDKSGRGFLVFLEAWARYEDEIPSGDRRRDLSGQIRREIGTVARQFFEHGDDG
jgi:hypothetical protein